MPDILVFGITGFLVWLMGLSSWHKFRAPSFYGELIAGYFPGLAHVRVLVYALALFEGGIVLLLLLPATRAPALGACAGILLAYALLMLVQIVSGRRDQRCGCAGPASDVALDPLLILRNVLCAMLSLMAVQWVPGPLGPVLTGLLALSVAGFLIVMYLCCEQLISNAQRMSRGM
ncbi:MauE/DoxX family redox-associated membrane protein [Parahaliea mediterranea]|uniref:MauE/DoxX family redox-associated membrane protein n=1 Tax=Parahaliea mediterranea TaxID=651086 RepID=UPI000E2FE074|nr:MauE/DoxX family redox-associated membrane protein [Parahaliea mediterranea]